jgi:predicted NUDIX family phosphoesterase
MSQDETILCVAKRSLSARVQAGGFIPAAEVAPFAPGDAWFGPRRWLEQDPEFKQLVPYVILSHRGRVAMYRRGKPGGERRLHGLRSIGFGGHVGLEDAVVIDGVLDVERTLATAARREILEEVDAGTIVSRTRLGYLLDEATPVGRVHLGVVELWTTAAERVFPREAAIDECMMASADELVRLASEMETWSSLSLAALAQALPAERGDAAGFGASPP